MKEILTPEDWFHGLRCVSDECSDHKHKRHPGSGHCGSCLDESNDGEKYAEHWTFNSRKAVGNARCCCRDRRIGA